jgi:hypothetical protein
VRHPDEKQQAQDLWLLERLRKEFGLMNCWQAANPNRNLPQTLRWSRDQATPYHCDGIFVPAAWYRYLDHCEVLASPLWEELSDHNPVVASFTPGQDDYNFSPKPAARATSREVKPCIESSKVRRPSGHLVEVYLLHQPLWASNQAFLIRFAH